MGSCGFVFVSQALVLPWLLANSIWNSMAFQKSFMIKPRGLAGQRKKDHKFPQWNFWGETLDISKGALQSLVSVLNPEKYSAATASVLKKHFLLSYSPQYSSSDGVCGTIFKRKISYFWVGGPELGVCEQVCVYHCDIGQ